MRDPTLDARSSPPLVLQNLKFSQLLPKWGFFYILEQMGKKAFIDKRTASHFQLVHRSQRDPNLANEDSSKYVLKPTLGSANLLKHGILPPRAEDFLEDVEPSIENKDVDSEQEFKEEYSDDQVGKAVQYGIFFRDQEDYDYMKHLKPIGEHDDGVFVAASDAREPEKRGLVFKDADAELDSPKVKFTLPNGTVALAGDEEEVGLLAKTSVDPLGVAPEYREAIYALDDENFIDEAVDDDFFDALNAEEVPKQYVAEVEKGMKEWEEFMGSKFDAGGSALVNSSDDEVNSYSDDYSDAPRTNFSMTSSAMFRNDNLTLLDDRFERVLEEYDSDSEESIPDLQSINHARVEHSKVCDAEQVGGHYINDKSCSKERLDKLLDEFLVGKAIVGKHMVSRDSMVISNEDFDKFRQDLLAGSTREQVLAKAQLLHEELERDDLADIQDHPFFAGNRAEEDEDRHDCETIISTYSNVYNRPTIIDEPKKRVGKKKKKTQITGY